MERAYERFLRYVAVPTASDEESTTVPTTQTQFVLAHKLVEEMKGLGISDAEVDEQCYVYGHIPASKGYEQKPQIGFIAHMDTVSDFAEHQVQPIIHENYDGSDVELGSSGRKLETKIFTHLPKLAGRSLITTDGTTILGADDKAGIAEILTLVERLTAENIPHGPISVGFTPDEEVGQGADHFDVERFGAAFAYTVDGGSEDELEYENFNASEAKIDVTGFNVHPGSSKDIMTNAAVVAMEINEALPKGQTPRDTEGYEGFFHLESMSGTVEKATLSYIIRDHDEAAFTRREQILTEICDRMNEKYGAGTVKLTIREQYRNMAEKIKECFHLIENAGQAMRNVGLEPVTLPIRGGTDGARLSFMGLPCPNLGTGAYAGHGPYEHITIEGMDKTVDVLTEIVKIYAK
ncbi:peptidase T [Blautia schinkii]|nr:peptidase T [Blautia schinkii]